MFVSAIVVHHPVKFDFAWKFLVQSFDKFEELLVAMAGVALADHFALRYLQGRKEGGRAMALVIVRHGSTAALLKRKARLRAIQGLDLTLLIHTEHQRFLGGLR